MPLTLRDWVSFISFLQNLEPWGLMALGYPYLKDILGSKSNILRGKKIALCITGSVAAVKCPEIARELMRHGADVYTVMSPAACKIIHPYLMEWATGNPVITELTGRVEHIWLAGQHSQRVDLVLVAPATANTISKIAHGIDDTPVTTIVSTALGSGIPVIIVPAMHESMYRHPIIKENIKKLKAIGIKFVGPRIEEGKAKIADIEDIVEAIISHFSPKDMQDLNVLVTAGPTIEYIDPIRIITNKSSGKMGIAIAKEALARGANVTLIYGPGRVTPPLGAKVIRVETTEEMYKAVMKELESKKYDLMIATAAVADYVPARLSKIKIPTAKFPELTLKLKATPKIIRMAKEKSPKTFIVAFKAEYNIGTEELIRRSMKLIKDYKIDLVAANDVSKPGVGFGYETNEIYVVGKEGLVEHIPLSHKRLIAKRLLSIIVKRMRR